MNVHETPGIGHNAPDYAAIETDRLARDYRDLPSTVSELLDEAREQPLEIGDDDTMGAVGGVIKRLRDLGRRIEAFREKEKEPALRAGNAVDGFFNGLRAKLTRLKKTDKAGAADVLQARIDDYQQRKLIAEQQRRRREAEEAERKRREEQARAAELARLAEEARLAAERARKAEHIAAKSQFADLKEVQAAEAALDAKMAEGAAAAKIADAYATPADIVRTRVDDVLVTMAQEPFAEVIDRDELDKAKLWPFFTDQEIAKALRGWAKTTGHTVQMSGASIGKRAKSVVR